MQKQNLKLAKRADFTRLYWNDHNRGITFLGVPKTASTAVRHAINTNQTAFIAAYPVVFSVIREPLDRFSSSVAEIVRRGTMGDISNLTQDEILDRCIEKMKTVGFFDNHLYPQTFYINGESQYIFLFEALNVLWDWLDVPEPPMLNHTMYIKPKLQKHHVAFLENVYSADIDFYNTHSGGF